MLHIAVVDGLVITSNFIVMIYIYYSIIKYNQFKLRTYVHASVCSTEPSDVTYFNSSLAFDISSHQILNKVEGTECRQTILLDFIVMYHLDVLLCAQYRFTSPLLIFVLRNNALKLLFEDEE